MSNPSKNNQAKHIKGFWSIFIVVAVSMIAGATIFAFAYGNILQDETDSISFSAHHSNLDKKSEQKTPAKSQAKIVPVKK